LDDIVKPLRRRCRDRDEIEEMVVQLLRLRPRCVLELASGGGWFVGRFLNNTAKTAHCIAIERDLSCLWTLQYKFRHVGAEQRAEAIGGDVRALPILDDAFDAVTCCNAFGEIAGLSAFLSEAHRVVRPDGHVLVCHSVRAIRFAPLSWEDFRRLAAAADLFAEKEQLLTLARNVGFVVDGVTLVDGGRDVPRFVARLRKE
jgi:ubiquinone/menaquinone biosynthesis C-methylase UbiE